MHLTDTSRPRLANGLPALLLDGSAVPHINVGYFTADTVTLSVCLRQHNVPEDAMSCWFTCKLGYPEIEVFFWHYHNDPEKALLDYFGWQDQRPHTAGAPRPKPAPRPMSSVGRAELQQHLDLL